MSTIERLAISGVRSFNPENPQVINFYKPLTIISGCNGAGKTTIIEALLNACTGAMPPGAAGSEKSSFIYDPKNFGHGSGSVKAQIRLWFNARGEKVILVVRSYESRWNRNRTKTQFTTLDCSLVTTDISGKSFSQSLRTTDCDVRVPELLGVSKAVLEHVIFCHQEDSNWPLLSSALVKHNFDEIFSATQYAAALDRLKDIRKSYADEAEKKKNYLEMLQRDKEEAVGIKKSIEEKEIKVNSMRENLASMSPLLKRIDIALQRLDADARDTESEEKEIANLRGRIEEKRRLLAEAEERSDLKSDNEDTAEDAVKRLTEKRQRYSSELDSINEGIRAMECKVREGNEKFRSLEQNIFRLEAKYDCLKPSAQKYHRDLHALQSVLQSIVNAGGGTTSIEQILAAIANKEPVSKADLEKLDKMFLSQMEEKVGSVKMLSKNFEDKAKESSEKILKLQRDMDAIETNRKLMHQKKSEFRVADMQKRNELLSIENKGQDLLKRLFERAQEAKINLPQNCMNFSCCSADAVLTALEAHVQGIDSRLAARNEVTKAQGTRKEEERLTEEVKLINASVADLRAALTERASEVHDRSQLTFLKEQLKEKREALSDLLSTETLPTVRRLVDNHNDRCTKADMDSVNMPSSADSFDDLCATAQLIRDRTESALVYARGRSEKHALLMNAKAGRLQDKRMELARLMSEASVLEKRFNASVSSVFLPFQPDCGRVTVENYTQCLSAVESRLEEAKLDATDAETTKRLYSYFVEKAQSDRKCTLCERELDEKGLEAFITRNYHDKSELAEVARAAVEELPKLEISVAALKSVSKLVVQLDEIKSVIPGLEKAVAEGTAEVEAQEEEKNNMDEVVSQLEQWIDDMQPAADCLLQAQELTRGVSSLKHDVARVEQRLADSAAHNANIPCLITGTTEDIQREYDARLEKLMELNNSLSDLRALRCTEEAAIREDPLEVYFGALKETIMEFRVICSRCGDLSSSLSELQDKLSTIDNDLKDIETAMSRNSQEVEDASRAQQHAKKEFEECIKKESDACASAQSTYDCVSKATGEIYRHLSANVTANLSSIETDLKSAREEHQNLKLTLYQDRTELEKLRKQKNDIEEEIKRSEEHLSATELLRDLNEMESNVQKREDQLVQRRHQILQDVENDLDMSLELQISASDLRGAMNLKYVELSKTIAYGQGEIKTLERELLSLRQEIQKKRYDNIEMNTLSAFINHKTAEMARDDIERYSKALERAVQSFHQEKIEHINQIIQKFWCATYKGNDIDSIEIRSEHDSEARLGESEFSRKSYKYRVVMKRGNTDLDMRGRCSAGQKVLASCIIRLALSMAFCCECGILALDEPTTNLDVNNVESLANALKDLIRVQKTVRHFQLIIITHDEAFVRALGSHTADNFYYVHKDLKGMFSIIEPKAYKDLF